MNITFLQDKKTIDRMFVTKHLQQLSGLGTVKLNEGDGVQNAELMKRQIAGADIAITSWGCGEITEDVLAAAPNLKLLVHAAGTVKGIVTPELWAKGVKVSNCTDPLGKGVAETALGMLIASLKDMFRLSAWTREGNWGNTGRVKELYDIKVGVISAGRAGSHFIRLLRQFDVDILVYDPMLSAERAAEMGATKVEFEQLLTEADAISIHAPTLPSTVNMFNKHAFSLMKDDCILINTARGVLINEEELIAELEKGRFFACIDVTNPEPPVSDHRFRSLPNVMLTPHIAGAVNNGLHRMGQFVIDEIKRFQQNEQLLGEVKEEQLSGLA